MNKLNVCVIFGGRSSEHEVSRKSAKNIIHYMNKDKYNVYPLGITKTGEWLLFEGDINNLDSTAWESDNTKKAIISPDTSDHGLLIFTDNGTEKLHLDVAFIIIHGKNGEDGTIQGLLELACIPYTGPKVLGSAVCMDKAMAKDVLKANGIPVANGILLRKSYGEEQSCKMVKENFTYPVFIKPANAGSSIGCSKVDNDAELKGALEIAFANDKKVLVEEYVDAIEVECAVMGNDNPKVAKLGQIFSGHEFYDYDAKYTTGVSETVIPAHVPDEIAEKIGEIAKRAYIATECCGFTRIDFFVEKATNRIILNELNTLPGFTDISMFPMMWEACGQPYSETIDKIISLAFEE